MIMLKNVKTLSSRYWSLIGLDLVSSSFRMFFRFMSSSNSFYVQFPPKFHWQMFKAAATYLEFKLHVNPKPQGLCAVLAKFG